MAQTTQQIGDILANAPIAVPTNFLQLADGIACRCDSNANNIAGNDIVAYTATIPLATAPATNLIEGIGIIDHTGEDVARLFSRQYLVSSATSNQGIIIEFNKELKEIFGRYVVGSGNVTAARVGTDLVITVSTRLPVKPWAIVVDGTDIAFV